jgi:hypothetical protein
MDKRFHTGTAKFEFFADDKWNTVGEISHTELTTDNPVYDAFQQYAVPLARTAAKRLLSLMREVFNN